MVGLPREPREFGFAGDALLRLGMGSETLQEIGHAYIDAHNFLLKNPDLYVDTLAPKETARLFPNPHVQNFLRKLREDKKYTGCEEVAGLIKRYQPFTFLPEGYLDTTIHVVGGRPPSYVE